MSHASNKSPRKRTLDDFFGATATSSTSEKSARNAIESPPGLSIMPQFITPTEESTVIAFLSMQNWRTDLSRRSVHYGGTYCLLPPRDCSAEDYTRISQTIITAAPFPSDLSWLVDRMVSHSLHADANRPEFCIVNEYSGNLGISAHVENFRFAEPVCGLTLQNGDFMRFHELTVPDDGSVRSGKAGKAERTGRRVDVWLPRRSLMVLKGDARNKWQHEILRSRKGRFGKDWKRVSLTFRVEKRGER